MKTKSLILSLMATTLINMPSGFAEKLDRELKRVRNTKLELMPVKIAKGDTKNGLDFKGKSLLPLQKKAPVVLEDFQIQHIMDGKPGVKLVFDEEQQKALESTTRKYVNSKLALIHNGRVLLAPNMKSIVKEDAIDLSFKDQKEFEAVLDSLEQS